jgi:tetratricopeptide (TPR) repeat protein
MWCPRRVFVVLLPVVLAACAWNSDKRTLAQLRNVEPDLTEVRVENGLDQAIFGYRKFLEEAPPSSRTPEAMRRLADLELEREYGLLSEGPASALPAPERSSLELGSKSRESASPNSATNSMSSESDRAFEQRATRAPDLAGSGDAGDLVLPGRKEAGKAGPLEAIKLYDEILAAYPDYPFHDQILYQKARAFDELGRNDEAIVVIERLISEYPESRHIDEVQFRRAEYFFVRRKYFDAEKSYESIVARGAQSDYYELALYKLGWTLYKLQFHKEALHQYIALLDYKVSVGYDFSQSQDPTDDEVDGRRIADTHRVISLCFSELGGATVVEKFFDENGSRSYEDRIYSHLGDFYFEKLRYNDAAEVYTSFVDLYPFDRISPQFGMRVVEIYEAGGFPKLVLESKKDFAARYGLQAEYWTHFDSVDTPEVLSYLKSNLKDLANHYHALYQDVEQAGDKPAHFAEASRWYRAYLTSFSDDPETPSIHYQLADLLLEHELFSEAALEYERTAYEYPEHGRAAAAGYAAIFAHREHQRSVTGEDGPAARRAAMTSTLKFVDTFPTHEHAAVVLGAAVDDMYALEDFEFAIETGRRLIDNYPEAELQTRRSAWMVIAHGSFELVNFEQAEHAYSRVLDMTPEEDDAKQDVVENLAASIYKQGEQANEAEDYRSAADHFLRIAQVAPDSGIRPVAEYDAGAALIRLEDWAGAAAVLDVFRQTHPDHELGREATKQMAFVYREDGNLAGAAKEYERVAAEAEDPELRSDALLVAGGLYETSELPVKALAVYLNFVREFSEPIERVVETRFKMADIYSEQGEEKSYHEELRLIVEIDRTAGGNRTDRVRYLAARSALVLSERLYGQFSDLRLAQPFEQNLRKKQDRMDTALAAFGELVSYEVGEVTAAATFYIAEVYYNFSQALLDSERPSDLAPGEMQDYEMVLEEEAFPFEEQAIEVHEKNLELMAAGVYNVWIENSLEKLAVMMPGRYAKFEASSGPIDSLDTYAYHVSGPTAELLADVIVEETAVEIASQPLTIEDSALLSDEDVATDETGFDTSEDLDEATMVDGNEDDVVVLEPASEAPEGVEEELLSDAAISASELENMPAAPDMAFDEILVDEAGSGEDESDALETESVNGGGDATAQ